ncbi:MmcQ/YjbR family DNA-binding protein [Streptomyces sp. NPDC057438]|uniref:MmcQ/YjbR family DNA-binding protein n=1 Tax=Streptomyces sp. NPDC057438 TaxID=3346133 RepID=UPI00368E10F4
MKRGYASITPGRYLDKRHWISLGPGRGITKQLINDAVEHSYDLVIDGLPQSERPYGSASDKAVTDRELGR